MLRIPTLAIHGAAVALSAVAHAAILVAVGGHGSTPVLLLDDRAAEVDLTTDRVVEPPDDDDHDHANAATPAAAAHHARTHTHPYPVPASHDSTPHDPSLVHLPGAAAPVPSPAQLETSSPATPTVAAEALPRFNVAIQPGSASGSSSQGGTGSGAGDAPPQPEAPPLPERSVSVPARLQQGVTPSYPPAARAEGVEADVPLELVVSRAGAVESARVLQHAGLGFDEAALDAIRRYRFSPAVHDGHPTRVVMRWTMQFRLR